MVILRAAQIYTAAALENKYRSLSEIYHQTWSSNVQSSQAVTHEVCVHFFLKMNTKLLLSNEVALQVDSLALAMGNLTITSITFCLLSRIFCFVLCWQKWRCPMEQREGEKTSLTLYHRKGKEVSCLRSML